MPKKCNKSAFLLSSSVGVVSFASSCSTALMWSLTFVLLVAAPFHQHHHHHIVTHCHVVNTFLINNKISSIHQHNNQGFGGGGASSNSSVQYLSHRISNYLWSSNKKTTPAPNSMANANYFLRFVHNHTAFPIVFERRIPRHHPLVDYKWWQYSLENYVGDASTSSPSSSVNDQYFTSGQSYDSSKLYILAYDICTHEQLSAYEPRATPVSTDKLSMQAEPAEDSVSAASPAAAAKPKPKALRTSPSAPPEPNVTSVFALAYLRAHRLYVHKTAKKTEVNCSAVFLMPYNDNDVVNKRLFALLDKRVIMRMYIEDEGGGAGGQEDDENEIDAEMQSTAASTAATTNSTKRAKAVVHHRKRSNSYSRRQSNTAKHQQRGASPAQQQQERPSPKHSAFEVELREGPLVWYSGRAQVVSCSLTLLDYDHTHAYHDTIRVRTSDPQLASGAAAAAVSASAFTSEDAHYHYTTDTMTTMCHGKSMAPKESAQLRASFRSSSLASTTTSTTHVAVVLCSSLMFLFLFWC